MKKIFICKISKEYQQQFHENYYAGGKKGSSWYGGIDIGDYVFPVHDSKIEKLWRVKEFSDKSNDINKEGSVSFDLIKEFDKPINISNSFVRYIHFELNLNLLNKIAKSTAKEKVGFHEIRIDNTCPDPDQIDFTQKRNLYISLESPTKDIEFRDYDVRILIENLDSLRITDIQIYKDKQWKTYDVLFDLYKKRNEKDKLYSLNELLNYSKSDNAVKKEDFIIDTIENLKSNGLKEVDSPIALYDNLLVGRKRSAKSKKTIKNDVLEVFDNKEKTKDEDINYSDTLNLILYGPPGTGKTYKTILKAAKIIEEKIIDDYTDALKIFKDNLHDRIEFITFHQNYSYEDFIQGLRPDTENEKELTFERKDGVFKIISDKALKNLKDSEKEEILKRPFEESFNIFIKPLFEGEVEEIEVKMKKVSFFITEITNKSIYFRKASGGTAHSLSLATLKRMYDSEDLLEIQGLSTYYSPLLEQLLVIGKEVGGTKVKTDRKNYVLIIDEINRANISRVFGELITLIEPDKRSHGAIPMEAKLPSGDTFIVPSNLYIIGTMNTADKSIALLDIALRRRFEFEALYPKDEIKGHEIYDVDILKKINEQIIKLKGHDFQIGHSYFMNENNDLVKRMNNKVIPLLLEYFMNDKNEVVGILNNAGLEIEADSWPLRITGMKIG